MGFSSDITSIKHEKSSVTHLFISVLVLLIILLSCLVTLNRSPSAGITSSNNYNDKVSCPLELSNTDNESCPAGVLFRDPVIVAVRGGVDQGYCISDDICSGQGSLLLRCDNYERNLKVQYLPGNLLLTGGSKIIDEKHGIQFEVDAYSIIENIRVARRKRTAPGELKILGNITAMKDMIEETKQLFFFMTDINSLDTSPDLEISKLLDEVFDVMLKRCNPSRLEPLFLPAIHKAFLWLLTMYGTSSVEDMQREIAIRLKKSLQDCANDPHVINVHETDCFSQVTAVSLEMTEVGEAVKEYRYDDKHAFQWGLYDPIVDSVWLSIDTVHSLCSQYLERDGLMHEFALNMIKLLNIERMGKRWISPTPLYRQDAYDRVFLSPMNESVRILDACNVGGTITSPFGRSRRPLPRATKRKHLALTKQKRSTPQETRAQSLRKLVYCLQNEKEKNKYLKVVRKASKC